LAYMTLVKKDVAAIISGNQQSFFQKPLASVVPSQSVSLYVLR